VLNPSLAFGHIMTKLRKEDNMAKADLLVKINPFTWSNYLDAQNGLISDSTKSNTGVFTRFSLCLEILRVYQDTTMPKSKLKELHIEANARAYPDQDIKSHRMWAGIAVNRLVKSGIAEVVE